MSDSIFKGRLTFKRFSWLFLLNSSTITSLVAAVILSMKINYVHVQNDGIRQQYIFNRQ